MSSKDYIVSALKYRPAEWDEVVGQSGITSTLKNAIAREQIAKAYLFCGPRGVGKTTSARIFAKAINSQFIKDGTDLSFNIFELDAASNNSVDDIRQLIDQVRIQPQLGKYKVYIIDEVHMLSTQAFNAFLKTLEEPPPHAIFILATTEKHKVLPTILSRCQIYDFQRIQVRDMVEHLGRIAEDQDVTYQEEALHLIATKADGALRDALSLFDQMVSFSGKDLTYEAVASNLNVLDHEFYGRIIVAIAQGDIATAMLTYDEILKKGFDSLLFMIGLAEHLRNLLIVKDPSTVNLLDAPDSLKQAFIDQSQLLDMGSIVAHLSELHKTEVNYRTAKNKRLLTEITLMRLCAPTATAVPVAVQKKKPEPALTPSPQNSLTSLAPSHTPSTPEAPVQGPPNNIEHTPPAEIPTSGAAEENNHNPVAPTANEASPLDATPVVPSIITPNSEELITNAVRVQPEAVTLVAEPSPEIPKPMHTRSEGRPTRTRRGGISLSELDVSSPEDIEAKVEAEVGSIEGKHLKKAELMVAWKAYADVMYTEKKYSFHSMLANRDPEVVDDYTIKLTLENNVQLENLNSEKAEFMGYLRKELDHEGLRLIAEVNEEEATAIAYKTSSDQLREMVKKNPVLQTMFEKFDLDVD